MIGGGGRPGAERSKPGGGAREGLAFLLMKGGSGSGFFAIVFSISRDDDV